MSIVMPVRNEERFVEAAMRSVLAQTHQNIELIVVDDGSTDRTREIVLGVADARITLIPGPQRGLSAARNEGLAAASGAFLGFCDGDDLSAPTRVARQLAELESVGADVVGSTYLPINVADQKVGEPPAYLRDPTSILVASFSFMPVCGPSMLLRREVFERTGPFDDAFFPAEDYEWVCRALRAGVRFCALATPEYLYRRHAQSVSASRSAEQRAMTEVIAETHRRVGRPTVRSVQTRLVPDMTPVEARLHASAVLQLALSSRTDRGWPFTAKLVIGELLRRPRAVLSVGLSRVRAGGFRSRSAAAGSRASGA